MPHIMVNQAKIEKEAKKCMKKRRWVTNKNTILIHHRL